MKKKIFLMITLLVGIVSAQATNDVVVGDVTIPQGGSGVVNIELNNNDDEFTAYQFRLILPEGLNFVADKKGNPSFVAGDRYDDHSISSSTLGVFSCISTTLAPISGTSGSLLSVDVTASADVAVGTKLNVTLGEIECTTSGTSPKAVKFEDVTFTVIIGDPADTHVVLDETSTTAPVASGGAVDIMVKRTIKANEWSTLVLPFSLTADKVKAMFGDNVKLAKYTGSTKNTEDGYILNFEKTETITAGEPVLICGADEKSDNTYLAGKLTLGTDDNRGSDVVSNVSMTDPTTDTSNQFNLKGTYIHNASFIQAGDYYLGSGNALHHAKSAKALGSARMVVRYEGKNPQAKLAALNFDGVTTGIDEVRMDNDTREALTGSSSAPAYNLNGQRVGTSYKGIIIINGKKILKH